jgi:hypothetical protein
MESKFKLKSFQEGLEPILGDCNHLDLALDKYDLKLKNRNNRVWFATLLPKEYDNDSNENMNSSLKYKLINLIPSKKIRTALITSTIISNSLKTQLPEIQLMHAIDQGEIDGFYLGLTGPEHQRCLEHLSKNMQEGIKSEYLNAHQTLEGGISMGWALSNEVDPLGMYLQRGEMKGQKTNGNIDLSLTHPSLNSLIAHGPDFNSTYNQLIKRVKQSFDFETLYESK